MKPAIGEPRIPDYRQPRLSLRLLRAARTQEGETSISLGQLIRNLGESSFGWCLLVFAMVNMMPLPVGTNLVTALPLLILSGQMLRGWHHVHVPEFISRRRINSLAFRRRVASMRFLTARLERLLRPRQSWLFAAAYYRAVAAILLTVSFALFLPIPGSGLISASGIFLFSVGRIADDGLVAIAGLSLGMVAVGVAIGLAGLFTVGITSLF